MREFELEPGEFVVRLLRKHWLLFLAELLPYAILAMLPLAIPNILALVPQASKFAPLFDYGSAVPRIILGLWLLVIWTSAWGHFTRYFLNAWVLTSQRIVNIKQRAFFSRQVSSLFLS